MISQELRAAGATFDTLEELVTGIDPETRDWVASTPGVRKLLRAIRQSGHSPNDILRSLEKVLVRKGSRQGRKAR
jgi:hypothetical protein